MDPFLRRESDTPNLRNATALQGCTLSEIIYFPICRKYTLISKQLSITNRYAYHGVFWPYLNLKYANALIYRSYRQYTIYN